jgi:phosphoesterase RecJ-like protein
MSVTPVSELAALVRSRDNFLITSHARPDGDAIGSSLGLMHLLHAMGKRATVALHDPLPHMYCALPGADSVIVELPAQPAETAVFLECSSVDRSGYDVLPAEFSINIDHHQSGREFADFNWIDPQECAVGAMVYQLAVALEVTITPAMATCLYTAILTDTGSFNYASTTASTFAVAQHLVESGASPSQIAQTVYASNAPSKFHLLGEALRSLHVEAPIAWAWITQANIAEARAGVEDTEGVVNYLIGIIDVRAAVFLRELPNGDGFRLSLRSKEDVDVAKVAEAFGGGGHRNASGCTVTGALDSVLDRVLPLLRAHATAATPASATLC